MPDARCTRGLVLHFVVVERTRVTTSTPDITRHSRTQWFLTVSFVLSPVTGLFCHRHQRTDVLSAPGWADITSANLTPTSGRQDHTTFAVRSNISRPRAL